MTGQTQNDEVGLSIYSPLVKLGAVRAAELLDLLDLDVDLKRQRKQNINTTTGELEIRSAKGDSGVFSKAASDGVALQFHRSGSTSSTCSCTVHCIALQSRRLVLPCLIYRGK